MFVIKPSGLMTIVLRPTHGRDPVVDPLSYFSFEPLSHDRCNKGRGIRYPVWETVLIKYPLPLNEY